MMLSRLQRCPKNLSGLRAERQISSSIISSFSVMSLSYLQPLSSSTSSPSSSSSSQIRGFSSKNDGNKKSKFRPRRRQSHNYRPPRESGAKRKKAWNDPSKGFPMGNLKMKSDFDKVISISPGDTIDGSKLAYDDSRTHRGATTSGDKINNSFNKSAAAAALRSEHRGKAIWGNKLTHSHTNIDAQLRMADYITAEKGSTEDMVGEKKYLALSIWDKAKRNDFMTELNTKMEEQSYRDLDLDLEYNTDPKKYATEEKKKHEEDIMKNQLNSIDNPIVDDEDFDENSMINSNQLAHGDWGELVIDVGRVVKVWRGGRIESYRALVIGGNLNGCGGFGIGKGSDPSKAAMAASRQCKRNIFFVDRYQNDSLTFDLVGKQNSCRVYLRRTNGMRGNPLVMEILLRFGITNCVSKSHGNRNPYNIVRATFKALMTHESLDEIALNRGKRLFSLDRTKRLRI